MNYPIFGTCFALRAVVRRRSFAALAASSLVLGSAGRAQASGWLSSGAFAPIEQRIALAVGPTRSTVWTSLRFDAASGPVGVIVPAPPGASVDWSSDAWFEALEVATAPRVFPPEGVTGTCPGEEPLDPFHIAGSTEHFAALGPDEVVVLEDAAAVGAWAEAHSLGLSPGLAASLGQITGQRFISARFSPGGGVALTPTLRVVLPGGPSMLPLALTRAAPDVGANPDLIVTTWVIGPGLAAIEGSVVTPVPPANIVWNAANATSRYADARAETLSEAGPLAAVLECASHEALSNNISIAEGTASIDGVITAFFERAAGYGSGLPDPAPCVAQAAAMLATEAPVAASCPRADLGVVGGVADCVETTAAGETDPETLRCGEGADDLAVALSGQVPVAAWLTRHSLLVAAGSSGSALTVTFPGGAAMTPVLRAESVDLSECGGSGGGSGTTSTGPSGGPTGTTSSGTSSSGTSGGGTNVPTYREPVVVPGCDCGSTADTADGYYETAPYEETTEGDSQNEDGCGSDTTDTTTDDDDGCSGDTTETGDSAETSGYDYQNEDDCGSDTTDTTSGSDGCSSDSSGSSSGDSCGSDSKDSGCAVAKSRRRRTPKLSLMTFCAAVVLAPLRRARRSRRFKRTADPEAK